MGDWKVMGCRGLRVNWAVWGTPGAVRASGHQGTHKAQEKCGATHPLCASTPSPELVSRCPLAH